MPLIFDDEQPKGQGQLVFDDEQPKAGPGLVFDDGEFAPVNAGRTFGGTLKDVGVTALKSAVSLPQGLIGTADLLLGNAEEQSGLVGFGAKALRVGRESLGLGRTVGEQAEKAGIRITETQKILDENFSPAQKAAQARVQAEEGFIDTSKALLQNPSVIAQTVGESVAPMLGGMGMARGLIGVAPKVISGVAGGAAGEGVISAGTTAEDFRVQSGGGPISEKQRDAAAAAGVGTALFAFVGGKLAKKLGLVDVDTALATGEVQKSARGFAARLAGGGVTEGVFEELPQSMQEQIWHNYGMDKPLLEGVGEAGAYGMMAGAAMGAGVGAITGGGKVNTSRVINDPELDAKAAVEGLDELMGRINENYTPPQIAPESLTPEQSAEADVQLRQLQSGIEVGPAATGPEFVQVLDGLFKDNQPDIGGQSQEVIARREGEEGPSPIPHSQRVFTTASDPKMEGLTPMQVGFFSPGVVATLAPRNDERNYPSGYGRALTDTVQQWVRKYMPNARVIINLDSIGDNAAFGAYQRAQDTKGNIIHVITPREMPSLKYQGGGNSQTRMEALTALGHEFGHGMAEEAFFEGLRTRVGDEVKNQLQSITKLGTATPEQLAALTANAPLEAGLVQEWLDLKTRVESGEMTAKEWLDTWAGARKHGTGIHKELQQNMDPYEWAKGRLKGKTLEAASAKDLIMAAFPGGMDYALSFDEYFAEQMSRAAYAKGDLAASPLNKLFNDIIGKLREFFAMLKKEGVVKPGTKFNEWLEDLTAKNAAMKRRPRGTQRLSKAVTAKQKELREQAMQNLSMSEQVELAEEAEVDAVLAQEEAIAEVVPPKEELASGAETKGLMLQELDKMIADGVVEADNLKLKSIRHRISLGEYEAAREKMQELQDDLMYDREYTTRAIQRLPNKQQIKLETIKALMGQQTLRKQDRSALEQVYEATQAEGLPSVPREDVIAGIMDRALPLKITKVDDIEFAYRETGWAEAGENPARSVVWALRAPVQVSRDRAMDGRTSADHWKDAPDVVAHARLNVPVGEPGNVILGELQSDLFTKSSQPFEPLEAEYDPDYDPDNRSVDYYKLDAMQAKWHEPALQEVIGKLAEMGYKTVLIPLESAVVAMQGFTKSLNADSSIQRFPITNRELEVKTATGETVAFEDSDQYPTLARVEGVNLWIDQDRTVMATVVALDKAGNTLGVMEQPVTTDWGQVTFTGQPADNLINQALQYLTDNAGYRPEAQSTIDFYEKTLQGFLKSEKYKLKKVERNELDYLEVDLTDPRSSLVVRWDRENPAAPNIPLAHTQESAGVQDQAQIEDSLKAWDTQGTLSIFFKRWWGQGKLVNVETLEPLKYWYRTGEVSLIGETPVYTLHSNWRNPAWGMQDIRDLRDYYVKAENPMRVEYPKQVLTDTDMQSLVMQAQAGGFDSIVLKHTGLPFEDNQVLVWDPEQLADGQLSGVPEKTYFDLESPAQASAHSTLTGTLKEFLRHWTPGVAMAGKLFDNLVQMQQRAVRPLYGDVFDQPLQQMVKYVNLAETFKNRLQVQGEKAVKDILALGIHKQNLIEGFLQAEWKSGLHWTALAQDNTGNYAYQPSPLFRDQLKQHGIDPTTAEGQEMAQLILDYKNGAQMQLNALEQILLENAVSKYAGNDLVIARVHQKIQETFGKLRATPFMPQGHFGQYVVIVRESKKKNGKKFVPVHVEHFEDEKSFQKARVHWLSKQDANPQQYKVKTKELKEFNGIPTNLPANILQNFQETGLFSEEQLETAMELMQPDLVDKVVKKFEDATSKLDGASKDFVRNYADFIWHNANFTWKLRYRTNFSKAIQWQQYEIRELHKPGPIPAAERTRVIALRERNLKMMENTKSYMLYPTQEFQSVRLWVTLAMLAYNFKTALLNVSTMLNTGAALTTEYGEVQGTRYLIGAMQDLTQYKLDTAGWVKEPKDNVELKRRMAFSATMNDAIRDGVIDQSYAYFLAGQSTSSAMLRHFRRTTMGHMTRQFIETGMWTFRTVEKLNRATTLMSFFNAEFDRLQKLGTPFDTARRQAYETAQSKTLLLQNAYDAGNRAQFLRGPKAVMFIFMSYVQFMGWIMSGGYERGQRAQFRAEGRAVRPWVFGTTAKLWLMFLLLSGIEGLPGFGNLLDILQAIWRKLSGGENLRLEMRRFFQEYGLDSNLVMDGLLHNAGGLNLSGSFGLGNIVPGTEMLNRQFETPGDLIGKGVSEISGPAGGVFEDIIKAGSMIPKAVSGRATAPEVMKELPGALGAIGRALDAHHKQSLKPTYGVTSKGGERLTQDLETGEFRDLSDYELAMMALGARPAMLAQNQERQFSKTGEIIYWRTRRSGLLETYRKAVAEKDLDKRKAAQAAIDDYNEQVPNLKMKITVKDRLTSVRNMRKRNRKLEQGGATEKRYQGLVRDVDEAF